jgi:hypothetical protein
MFFFCSLLNPFIIFKFENEHCVLVALPYGTNNVEQLTHANYLKNGFITYLQDKTAAGIINVTIPEAPQVHIDN